jgi:hypothetical protein
VYFNEIILLTVLQRLQKGKHIGFVLFFREDSVGITTTIRYKKISSIYLNISIFVRFNHAKSESLKQEFVHFDAIVLIDQV